MKLTQIETLNTSSGSTASASAQSGSESEGRSGDAAVFNFEQILEQHRQIGPIRRQFELNRLVNYIAATKMETTNESQTMAKRSFSNDYQLGKVLG